MFIQNQDPSKNSRTLLSKVAILTTCVLGAWVSSAQTVVTPPKTETPKTELSLRQLADARGFLIGGAISATVLDPDSPEYGETVAKEYNVVVTENAMKWSSLNNAPGQFNFTLADLMLKYANAHKQVLRGHTLVWHEQLPRYVGEITDKAALLAALKEHVQGVVTQYKGRIKIWDVVNETISDGPGNPLRENSPFVKIIGPEFIEMAFRWAHEADPDAKLYYNDYNTEGLNGKSDAVFELVKGLLAKGVPIHGVGFQTHVDMNFSVAASKMRENLERFRKLGLAVQLTEVDVQLKGDAPKAEKLKQQAKVYSDLLTTCLAVKCEAFLVWGVSDQFSWRSSFKPLLFDEDYLPKPAYFALRDVLLNAPK